MCRHAIPGAARCQPCRSRRRRRRRRASLLRPALQLRPSSFPGDNPGQGVPANETWQRWDAGIGLWRTSANPDSGSLFTLRQYALEHLHAAIAPADPDVFYPGGFNMLVGGTHSGQSGATYRIDDMFLGGYPNAGYDFEPPITNPEVTVHAGRVVEGNDGYTLLPVRIRIPG